MSDSLKAYMEKLPSVSLKRETLDAHLVDMRESVVPAIERKIRENDQRAADLRYMAASRHRNSATKPDPV